MSQVTKRETDGTTITESSHHKSYFLSSFRDNTSIETTVSVINTNYLVQIPNPAVDKTTGDFTVNSLGSNTYELEYTPIDANSRTFRMDIYIDNASTGTNNINVEYSMGYTPSGGSEVIGDPFMELRANTINTVVGSSFSIIDLNSGDKLKLYLKNLDGNQNIRLVDMRLLLTEL